jgi:hypothetical protein
MNGAEREGGLVGRIRQMRRQPPLPGAGVQAAPAGTETMAERLAHLEELVEGLQDAIYREAQRHDKRLAEVEAQIDPAAMATALSKHARERGL